VSCAAGLRRQRIAAPQHEALHEGPRDRHRQVQGGGERHEQQHDGRRVLQQTHDALGAGGCQGRGIRVRTRTRGGDRAEGPAGDLGDSTHDKYEDAEDDPRRRVGGAERSEHGCSQWYAGELLGEESTYGYVTLVVQTGAALIAATQIARAGVVGSPWCWAPLWVLGFQALAWAVPQIVFVPIGPGAIQSWADLLVLVGALAALSGTLGLGIMALVLAAQQRPDTVEVYRSA